MTTLEKLKPNTVVRGIPKESPIKEELIMPPIAGGGYYL